MDEGSDLSDSAIDPARGFRVGDWQVQPTAGEVIGRDGIVHHLEPKVMDVLVELARAWPEVLEREEAIRVVWEGRPVADDGLARCIATLRKVLGDSRTAPKYIQTVPKRGYRLLVRVETGASPSGSSVSVGGDTTNEIEAWSGPAEFDNLKVIRLLGRGSMGVVHLAQETNLERLVAIKTLRGIVAGDGLADRRLRREASAAARIAHPNVTTVHRLGELPDGTPYIVMQYVRGRTLTSQMASSGSIDRQTAITVIRQIAQALEAAHREEVIHRDVKPGNVLIESGSDLAILSDFGIAGILESGSKIATRLTRDGEVLGDIRYISPEQARGDPPTPASDMYSLGIIAYELLTGAYPYRKNGLLPHLDEEPTPMSAVRENIDAAVERIIMQALAKRADDRPTATQFLAGLDERPAEGEAKTSASSDSEPSTRTRLIASLAIIVAVIVAIVVVLGFIRAE